MLYGKRRYKFTIYNMKKGSFINYRDTNYEVDKVCFYSPSRHAIDGEKFDLEINIHHGGKREL